LKSLGEVDELKLKKFESGYLENQQFYIHRSDSPSISLMLELDVSTRNVRFDFKDLKGSKG
jgi:hypothetical protein